MSDSNPLKNTDPELLAGFIEEAREHLEAFSDGLMEMEKGSRDRPLTPFIVLAAIGALARIGDPSAEDVLGELAGSDDPEICETAATALEEMMESVAASV